MEVTLPLAFTIGLFSTLHCVGMCGGIIGTLSLSLAPPIRRDRSRLLGFVLVYSLGRITSYAMAGYLLAALGHELFAFISPHNGHRLLEIFSSLLIGAIGMYLAGWFPGLSRLEHLGQPLWRRIEPVGRRLLPVTSLSQAYAFGSIWGWLPCGLVYTTLFWAAAAGSGGEGALLMATFGIGTLPMVLAAGLLSGGGTRYFRQPGTRRAVGVVMMVLAVASIWYQVHPGHAHIH